MEHNIYSSLWLLNEAFSPKTTGEDDCEDLLKLLGLLSSNGNDAVSNTRVDEQAYLRNRTSLACSPAETAIYFSPKEMPQLTQSDFDVIRRCVMSKFAGIKLKFDDVDIGLIKMIWNPLLVTASDLSNAQNMVRDIIASLIVSLEMSEEDSSNKVLPPAPMACINF